MTGRISHLLDTDCMSSLMQLRNGPVERKLFEFGQDAIATSVLVAAELRFGVAKKRSPRLEAAVTALLERMTVLPFEPPADARYAELRAGLERAGTPIGPNDMLIAAHALALDLTLVTGNEREFRRVPGLKVENWLAD